MSDTKVTETATKVTTDERCPYDPSYGYVLECEIGQYGLCPSCIGGDYAWIHQSSGGKAK